MNPQLVGGEAYGVFRRRLIRETQVALLYGLRFPNRHPRIPTIEVGTARFDPEFAIQFWRDALGLIND